LITKYPGALQVVGDGEHHHQTGYKEVADGQRDDEQIAHFAQSPEKWICRQGKRKEKEQNIPIWKSILQMAGL
jgi:hypothetical protein